MRRRRGLFDTRKLGRLRRIVIAREFAGRLVGFTADIGVATAAIAVRLSAFTRVVQVEPTLGRTATVRGRAATCAATAPATTSAATRTTRAIRTRLALLLCALWRGREICCGRVLQLGLRRADSGHGCRVARGRRTILAIAVSSVITARFPLAASCRLFAAFSTALRRAF